jgi:hypothetical protein
MIEDPTPRPNVAMGAFMGFLTMMLGLLLTALQPVVAFVIAYFTPAFQISCRLRSRRRDGQETRRA